jgi:hypothetical protein
MTKVYVVCENSYEYNDEVYYQPDGEGVIPKNGYTDPQKANQACLKANLEWFEQVDKDTWNNGLNAYSYQDFSGVCRRDGYKKIVPLLDKYAPQIYAEWQEGDQVEDEQYLGDFYKFLKLMTEEEQMLVIANMHIVGYVIKEIDLQ